MENKYFSNEEIIEKVMEDYVFGWANAVYYDKEEQELVKFSYAGNTSYSDRYMKIYGLENNWIANNHWNDLDILDDEEIEKIEKNQGDDYFLQADMHNVELLGKIRVDYLERLKNYLIFINEDINIWHEAENLNFEEN